MIGSAIRKLAPQNSQRRKQLRYAARRMNFGVSTDFRRNFIQLEDEDLRALRADLEEHFLCEGYKAFYSHVDPVMRVMADLLNNGRYADEIMGILQQRDATLRSAFAAAGRNDPCPCGSGRKYKHCHGR